MKRLVICCDGTWKEATVESAVSNIVRLRRMIKPRSESDHIEQVIYHENPFLSVSFKQ